MNCLFFAKRSHPMYKTLLLVLSVYLSSTNAFLFAATESQEVARTETVYLLIHGLASSAETWSDLIKKNPSINNNCPKASLGGPVEYSLCYRYEFSDKKVNGVEWENGDGGTFQELGDEIGLAVANIENLVHPKSIILVGHSRGGLAARAYVQSLTAETPYRLALFTIGTPHQGSPFGRVQHWLTDKGYAPDDVFGGDVPLLENSDQIKLLKTLLFSPSTGYLATAHNLEKKPVRNNVSAAIWDLNATVGNLGLYVATFGQIHSDNFRLGVKTPGLLDTRVDLLSDPDLFNTPLLETLIPGDYLAMRKYILENTGTTQRNGKKWKCTDDEQIRLNLGGWACNGDSIVPSISQRMKKIPGFATNGKPFRYKSLYRIHHLKQLGQVTLISNMLKLLAKDLAAL